MKCPSCGFDEDKVIDSRPAKEGAAIRRRRECIGCGNRFTTYEYIERIAVKIIKKDGTRESFERDKLMRSIETATVKRTLSHNEIEAIVEEIEERIQSLNKKEIHSSELGQIVMDSLLRKDEVAYVRFASVYKNFANKEEFIQEIEKLQNRKNN